MQFLLLLLILNWFLYIQGREISLVFCGDFNSTPHHGVNALITTGYIPEDYADWNDGRYILKITMACFPVNILDLRITHGFDDC